MILIDLVKELLFPRKCILCSRVLTREETDLCHSCRIDLPEYDGSGETIPYVDGMTALWFYEGNVRESLLRFKFFNKPGYAKAYGQLLAMRIAREKINVDLITWVPVSARRRRKRGYDQSELLARAVSEELGIEARPTLKKLRHNRAQSRISDAAQRRANVLGVYGLSDGASVKGKRVLLIDDIVTTGATAGECTRMLLGGEAEYVMLTVVAAGRGKKRK